MNEQVARDVVLVRAIETVDIKSEILSQEDRMYASRSAKELAQWQAADSKSPVTAEHFLQQRAELILKRLSERTPAFAAFAQRRPGPKRMARSTSSTLAIPSATIWTASRQSAAVMRFATWPAASRVMRMGALRSRSKNR